MDMSRYFGNDNEKPLEHLVTDGGMTSILRRIACVGDSLSSGELESVNADGVAGYHDIFDISWGQFLGRMCGSTVYNFSQGGMTAEAYNGGFAAQHDFWNVKYASDAYIIAMGCNDVLNQGQEMGSVDDIDLSNRHNNKKTFAGHYAEIIQHYKEIQPRAKFFLVTFPREDTDDERRKSLKEEHKCLLEHMCTIFDNCYLLDLHTYGPTYDDAFRKHFYLGGHLNAMGYKLTAEMFASYIDWIIRHRYEDFVESGFIGTELTGKHW